MPATMTSRERVRTAIARQIPDRVPVHDWPWPDPTIPNWHKQGLPADSTPGEYFGYDMQRLKPSFPYFGTPPTEVLEETDDYIVTGGGFGKIMKNFKGDKLSIPEIVECPIKTKDDWLPIREVMRGDLDLSSMPHMRRQHDAARAKDLYLHYHCGTGYDAMQNYIRSEQLLLLMAEDPEWIKEIVDAIARQALDGLKALVREGIQPDGLWTYNDMGYRNDCLFSPALYEQIIAPSDRERNEWAHAHGMQTILHSDGCIKKLIPHLIDVGFDCIQPLEVKAGMDVRELKRQYGDRLALFGGIDVRLMEDPDDSKIENEIREKFAVAKEGGGYLYHSDHSVPPTVSFEKYKFIMECVRKYGQY